VKPYSPPQTQQSRNCLVVIGRRSNGDSRIVWRVCALLT